ncbi:hypothetical protein M427DRAFT_469346 [Gonapodya prolifera JEL478]|uniref:Uncharacterized protein n=1 Tax=Gonapodya prolifera (strain JEL478) TaxID=1344416 RepID=A0A139ARH6_GONPJ|nr:hypothetical protein M427DRAFT_469346 [Gonapodya prolifera JEL478]|eukprot:KXS19123.1 hypothetical protein M427DRAFT_469346 [Gonapodya prolifera JEL478]
MVKAHVEGAAVNGPEGTEEDREKEKDRPGWAWRKMSAASGTGAISGHGGEGDRRGSAPASFSPTGSTSNGNGHSGTPGLGGMRRKSALSAEIKPDGASSGSDDESKSGGNLEDTPTRAGGPGTPSVPKLEVSADSGSGEDEAWFMAKAKRGVAQEGEIGSPLVPSAVAVVVQPAPPLSHPSPSRPPLPLPLADDTDEDEDAYLEFSERRMSALMRKRSPAPLSAAFTVETPAAAVASAPAVLPSPPPVRVSTPSVRGTPPPQQGRGTPTIQGSPGGVGTPARRTGPRPRKESLSYLREMVGGTAGVGKVVEGTAGGQEGKVGGV